MTKTQKYLEALKTFDDWVIVSEWAVRVGELYPDILEAANEQASKLEISLVDDVLVSLLERLERIY
jgi:exopolyphosphatase/pppGpp-phosphohydrolase